MQELAKEFLFTSLAVAAGVFFGLLCWYFFLFAIEVAFKLPETRVIY